MTAGGTDLPGAAGPVSSGRPGPDPSALLAADVVAALSSRGATVATAESLTGGLVCAALVAVPGASAVVRGGVVAYAPDAKTTLLGVHAALVREQGTVSEPTARAMAEGVRERLASTYAVATTGVAGPDPSEGHPPGTVHLAVTGPTGTQAVLLHLPGDRDAVRAGTVRAVLELLAQHLAAPR